jgi:NADH dehydrogenase
VAGGPHLLILGGGYVPITLTGGLKKRIRRGELRVTVVSRENFHAFHGFVGEMVTGRIGPSNMLSPVRRIFSPAEVNVAEIESIDLDGKRVIISRHLDGARFELGYDQLVLAVGSAENHAVYPGLAEHAYTLKSFKDCFRLKNHILEVFELAQIEKDPAERRRLLTFFVAGGGYAGTELAGEMADFVRILTETEYSGIDRGECRVVLVHPGKTIMPELYGLTSFEKEAKGYPKLVEYAMRHSRKLGVELMTETRVTATTPNEVHLSSGEHIPTRTVISAVGMRPQPVIEALDVPTDPRGRVETDKFLRVVGYENVWAGGDCAAVPHRDGGTCPPVGIYALHHGGHIAHNLRRTLDGKSLQPFNYRAFAQGVSIGRRTAVGEIKGVPIRGRFAWLMWRIVLFYFFPTWDRRLRLLADWSIWPLVGRDIVQLLRDTESAYEVRHAVYQPGELIAERARPVRHVHVIVEGECELFRRQDGVEQPMGELGPGEHFGRKWLEESSVDAVRAKSIVKTVALNQDQANELQDLLLSTGRLIARTGKFPTITAKP